jgi:hypothetical protein
MNSDNPEDSSRTAQQPVDQSPNPRWLEWCSDPRVEATILAFSALMALLTWGLVDR